MSKQPNATRRQFLQTAAAIAAPTIIPSSALGRDGAVAPSERIVMGGIGIRNRGTYVLGSFLPQPDVQFVAIADVRADRRHAIKEMADKKNGDSSCAMYRDFRELLTRDDIDAVLIATGNNWHATASIYAAEAGKDVYSEKPCANSIHQAQRLADTIRRTGRVFQAGTQRRSISNFEYAADLAHSGKLGNLKTLYATTYEPSENHGWLPAQPEPDPEVVDWNMWLGPAPWRPFNQAYVDGAWRSYYDFDAGAQILEWGSHTVDLCQWANQADATMPIEFESTENNITARYANGVTLVMDYLRTPFGERTGWIQSMGTCPVRYVGDEGWVETGDSGQIEVSSDALRKTLPAPTIAGTTPTTHVRNFLNCVKTRGKPNANADVMRKSHIACYAASIAWKLGRKVTIDPDKEEFQDDEEANRLRTRAMREPWTV